MVRSLLLTFALFLLTGAVALAQSTTALEGTVTDETGEALIGATVKVMRGTDFVRGSATNVEGRYRILLDPGAYTVVPGPDAPLLAPESQRQDVTVGSGGPTEVVLPFDTGIR